jgi:hypothetical protein
MTNNRTLSSTNAVELECEITNIFKASYQRQSSDENGNPIMGENNQPVMETSWTNFVHVVFSHAGKPVTHFRLSVVDSPYLFALFKEKFGESAKVTISFD